MKYRHYAPEAPLTIIEGKAEDTIAYINEQCEKLREEGKRAGVIATDETRGKYQAAVVKSIGSRRDEEGIARHLFGILREFDEEKVDAIFSESFDTPKMGTGYHEPAAEGGRPSYHTSMRQGSKL